MDNHRPLGQTHLADPWLHLNPWQWNIYLWSLELQNQNLAECSTAAAKIDGQTPGQEWGLGTGGRRFSEAAQARVILADLAASPEHESCDDHQEQMYSATATDCPYDFFQHLYSIQACIHSYFALIQ